VSPHFVIMQTERSSDAFILDQFSEVELAAGGSVCVLSLQDGGDEFNSVREQREN
jgi:hypothetical protein